MFSTLIILSQLPSAIISTTGFELFKINQCSEPNKKVEQIFETLGYQKMILPRRKFVWHPDKNFKNEKTLNQYVADGQLQCGLKTNPGSTIILLCTFQVYNYYYFPNEANVITFIPSGRRWLIPVPVIMFNDFGRSIFAVFMFLSNFFRFSTASSINPTPSFISKTA